MSTVTKIVCDFCNASPKEGWFFGHRGFDFTGLGRLVRVEAGEAAACAACKELLERKDSHALLKRCFCVAPEMRRAREFVEPLQFGILAHLTGSVRHVKLGDEQAFKDRFFERPCPCCQTALRFDRAEAKNQTIVRICPACKTELSVGPIGHKPDAEVRR